MVQRKSKPDQRRIKSTKVTIDGIEFASKTEAKYYCYLKRQREAGNITDIQVQPKFVLQPKCERFGRKYLPITYIADFMVTHPDGRQVVIDVKGYSMEDATLKRKMFAFKYPGLQLLWVAQSQKYSQTGWMDYDELQKTRRAVKRSKATAEKENRMSKNLWEARG